MARKKLATKNATIAIRVPILVNNIKMGVDKNIIVYLKQVKT